MGFQAIAMGSISLQTILFFLIILAVLQPVLSTPASAGVDICTWSDGVPILYHQYGSDACPPKFQLKPNSGDCEDNVLPLGILDSYWSCASFCQMRTTFIYGQEQPYVRVPMCRGGVTCTLSESVHQGYSWKAKMNGNFKYGPLTIGITGGYSEKAGVSQSYKFSKHLDEGQCGYWTFIPFIRSSCGTYTEGWKDVYQMPCETLTSTGNACVDQLVGVDSNDGIHDWRTVRGTVVFVFVDCTNLAPLPDEKQDPAYSQPGVKLPRDVNNKLAQAYQSLWQQSSKAPLVAQSDAAVCNTDQQHQANATNCLDAMMDVLDRGAEFVSTTGDESISTIGAGVTVGVSRILSRCVCLSNLLDACVINLQ
ncbi:hypothetical protein A1O3_03723 [Capronia epimyces CBS 606.96]|uniref:Uncharacterized protein n=1 Tax=Capronia epimyces CBS 606.96 TaxID=1182542 RepID=W9YWV6_9EURO|nr:uncharacterized protein A1O3_03723 [Capronia epimyces CBS 606.96]EXJ86769.1 hypothetical protein A1O3_03723 [Capronia epimyces CBS 606.96]